MRKKEVAYFFLGAGFLAATFFGASFFGASFLATSFMGATFAFTSFFSGFFSVFAIELCKLLTLFGLIEDYFYGKYTFSP